MESTLAADTYGVPSPVFAGRLEPDQLRAALTADQLRHSQADSLRSVRLDAFESTPAFAPSPAGAGLVLEPGPGGSIILLPNTPLQEIDLFIRNPGDTLAVGGLDLKIGLSGGASPVPTLTGLNLRSGPTFTTGNSVQSSDPANTGQLQFWSVSINDPFSPPSLPGAGLSTKIGTVTISTLGIAGGEWSLTLFSPETVLLDPFGDSLLLTLEDRLLEIPAAVPEPEETLALAGVALLSLAAFRSTARHRPPSATVSASRAVTGQWDHEGFGPGK